MMQQAETLRRLLSRKGLLVVPGVYDGLTSRIAQSCGFEALYMTGGGTAASYGYPDIGLLTMNEMLENVRRISGSVELPLIADADTGYGSYLNVYRTVREYEKAGAAAIQIEDQAWPKRSGHMPGKQVIEAQEMVGKVKAAADALPARTGLTKRHRKLMPLNTVVYHHEFSGNSRVKFFYLLPYKLGITDNFP